MNLEKLRELCSRLPKDSEVIDLILDFLDFEDEELKTICDAFPLLLDIAEKAHNLSIANSQRAYSEITLEMESGLEFLDAALRALKGAP